MVIGIVCEFDPLHRGHARLLSHARALGADTVVCAMSGSFTQRGSFAALSKTARAEMAVRCGADLVLELPTPWYVPGGDLRPRRRAAADLPGRYPPVRQRGVGSARPAVSGRLPGQPHLCRSPYRRAGVGLTFAARRQAAAASLLDNATAALLQSPNNTLAVEYLRALRHTRSTMTPCTLRREGAGHDGAPEGIPPRPPFCVNCCGRAGGGRLCLYAHPGGGRPPP